MIFLRDLEIHDPNRKNPHPAVQRITSSRRTIEIFDGAGFADYCPPSAYRFFPAFRVTY